MPKPIYTPENCREAYQLNWSLAVFWNTSPPSDDTWLEALTQLAEGDGVHLLDHRFLKGNVSQFLLSTRPDNAPASFVRTIKGRLQHLVRAKLPKAFRRNYGLRSVGDARGDQVHEYVRKQTCHHVMADARVQKRIETLSIDGVGDGLLEPRVASHCQFWYNLHLVVVNENRDNESLLEALERRRDGIVAIASKKSHLIGRGQVLADHLHVTLGCGLLESPREIALAYMNNLSYFEGMKPLFQYGFYVGTFGQYDLNAIRQRLAQ